MPKRLTNEIVDSRLTLIYIKRIDNYINNYTKIKFQCLVESCNYIWSAFPLSILNNCSGCPKCAGVAPLTNAIIDDRLIYKNIKRLSTYVDHITKVKFQCLIDACNYIWNAQVRNIVNGDHGCPNCVKRARLTNEIIDKRLSNRNIKRVDNFIGNSRDKILFQCMVPECEFCWSATPSHIINSESGCPKCAIKKNEKIVFNLLKNNNINFDCQYNIRKINNKEINNFKFDFYIKSNKIAIEYNGAQHYRPVSFGNISADQVKINFIKQQKRDIYIKNFCDENNIVLISIDGRKLFNSKLEQYVVNELIPYIRNL